MGIYAFTFMAAWAAVGLEPRENAIEEQVDLVEINHFFDDQGKHVFDQVIFYDWSPLEGRHQVRAWRLLKAEDQVPQRNTRGGGFVATWHDGEVLRRVRSTAMRETWTQHDPELLERDYLPKERRRELAKTTPTRLR